VTGYSVKQCELAQSNLFKPEFTFGTLDSGDQDRLEQRPRLIRFDAVLKTVEPVL
jgi:hypothetical protein